MRLFVTIHDLIFLKKISGKSNFFQRIGALYRKYCILFGNQRIDCCFTDSEYSMNDIKNKLPIKNVLITRICIDSFYDYLYLYQQKKAIAIEEDEHDFYFTVSGDAPSKNLLFIIDYFGKFLPKSKLYIAGVSKNSYLRKYASDYIVILKNNLLDEELIDYYSRCKVFLFLSLQEGFGIPALEALVCNAKIIASNRTSIPEIVENCAIMIDPDNEDQLTEAMQSIDNLIIDDELKKKRLEKYSNWKLTAEIVYEAFAK
jgi:glycosyltransferase involved in cell wall biosynthesis